MTHVALLRSINVGSHNRVGMPALKAIFTGLGHEDVSTYVQSGNVIFRPGIPAGMASSPETIARLEEEIERAILQTLGLTVPVVIRTVAELQAVVAATPFVDVDPALVLVVFLRGAPTKQQVATIDPARSPPDVAVLHGREVYCHCPRTFAKTKITLDWLEKRLGTVGTARNWRTVTTLAAVG